MKLEIEYFWASGKVCEFTSEDFIMENDEEIFLIGFDSHGKELSALGILELDDKFYCYHIKQMSQKNYEKIIDGKDGEKFDLLSDISTHFWTPSTFTKIDSISARLKYFLTDDKLELVQKGSYTHMEKGFMVYSGNGLYNPKNFNKPLL